MKIYQYVPDNDVCFVMPVGGSKEVSDALCFDEKIILKKWEPLPVEVLCVNPRTKRRLKMADFFGVVNFTSIVFGERVKELLRPLVRDGAEILALRCEGYSLFALNVTSVLDALDYENSNILCRETSDPALPVIMNPVFRESEVSSGFFFRLPYKNNSKIYFTQEFIDFVQEHEFTGFRYKCVFDSEGQD